ncbi:MAG TPA: ATP-binding protein [Vicinamibacterales bacterium]|jgi:signal transduction histidine kinase|nr:ATP-binding protein [Vicinamibacterales bacterium]
MLQTGSPVGAPAAVAVTGDAEGKLALAEFLLANVDPQASARRALEWLARQVQVKHAFVATIDPGSRHLAVLAESGLTDTMAPDFSLSLEDEDHPLIRALRGRSPVFLDRAPFFFRGSPDAAAHVVPLGSHNDEPTFDELNGIGGLLVVEAASPQIDPDVLWVAEVLGHQLRRLRTPQALSETRLGQERMLLYSIINAVTDPILLTDTEGRLLIANTRAEKLFSAPDDASEGWRRAVGLNNMLFSAALSTTAVEERPTEPARRELLLVDPLEGSDLVFELLSSRAKEERQGTYVVSVLRNVTDLAKAKEEIEESYRTLRLAQADVRDERHRLDLIIDSVADPILVTDEAGDIVLMNTPAERLFTAPLDSPESMVRRVRSNGAHLTSFVSSLLASGDEVRHRGEINLIDPASGQPSPVEAVAGTILSEQRELTWVVTILHDLRETIDKARLYQQLKEASAALEIKVGEATAELASQNELLRRQAIELEQASSLKSQFLANMSHELRTPLNAILGYTHMLMHGVSGPVGDMQRRSLTRIDSNSRHLLALINDILDITRIEAGRMPINASTFKVPQLVDEVMTELEPIIRRSNLNVRARVPASLPQLRSDRQKVKQILVNLLSNALKFTHEGSVTVTATNQGASRMVAISITDTGIGIAEADQARIFEDFRQLDSSPARGYGGTGLGLSICRRLAETLEGSIELRSESGRGSTFTLKLPERIRKR